MGPIEIIVIIAACLIVASVIGYSIYKKVTGKPTDCGCGHSCSACGCCSHSQTPPKTGEKNNK